jgi:hypothetical protein
MNNQKNIQVNPLVIYVNFATSKINAGEEYNYFSLYSGERKSITIHSLTPKTSLETCSHPLENYT